MSCFSLVLGDQLFADHPALSRDRPVLMLESTYLARRYRYHKFKLAYVYTCMREYARTLRARGYTVHYTDLTEEADFTEFFKHHDVRSLYYLRPTDKRFRTFLLNLCQELEIETYVETRSPMFLTPAEEFKDFFTQHTPPYRLASFYQKQRIRLNLFVTEDERPVGGKWSLDAQNRRKTPRTLELSPRPARSSEEYAQVCREIKQWFSKNPGNLPELYLPATHEDARTYLDEFFTNYLASFGDYEDALDSRDPFLYHGVLSPLLNVGLLTPQEVLDALLAYLNKHPDIQKQHFNSIEGFIRQLIGWREWMWGLYEHVYQEDLSQYNFFDHTESLPDYFYFENLDALKNLPLRDALQKTRDLAYNHHIERLMVLGNWMTLSEYNPHACYRWFLEMYVDAYSWVMVGNVYGMGLFADGGVFATKPYISSANYLRKMSHYGTKKKGDWGEAWDEKFWAFLFKHEEFFTKQPRMNMLIKSKKKKQ